MNFVEEKTPKGLILKIMFDKWQYLVFDRKGRSIYEDEEGKRILHKVLVMVFVGRNFTFRQDFRKSYTLLKIRKGNIIVPYIDLRDNKKKYFFIPTDKDLDLIPARILVTGSVISMIKEIDINIEPDYVIVDDNVTTNDVVLIKNRYHTEEIIYIELVNNYFLSDKLKIPDTDRTDNINMMSRNPVFLSSIHLRNMDISKINQLLLDFDISPLDTEFIYTMIQNSINSADSDPRIDKNRAMLSELRDYFMFYQALLNRNTERVKELIESRNNIKKLSPFVTLITKVKSMYPGTEEQLLYTEYENIVMDRRQALS